MTQAVPDWAESALRAMDEIGSAKSEQDTFSAMADFAGRMGADLLSYHYTPPPRITDGREDLPGVEVFATGFPDDWVKRYVEENLHRVDPITALAATRTRPFNWSEIASLVPLTPEQTRYLGELRGWLGEGDGMAVPAFGPSGQHGYFGFGTVGQARKHDPLEVRVIQGICGSMHLRFCELRLAVPGLVSTFTPTDREVEILRLVSQGHPDWLIGGLVGMNTEAVRDRVRNMMRDLFVSDRPSLLLRARGLGLVEGLHPEGLLGA